MQRNWFSILFQIDEKKSMFNKFPFKIYPIIMMSLSWKMRSTGFDDSSKAQYGHRLVEPIAAARTEIQKIQNVVQKVKDRWILATVLLWLKFIVTVHQSRVG